MGLSLNGPGPGPATRWPARAGDSKTRPWPPRGSSGMEPVQAAQPEPHWHCRGGSGPGKVRSGPVPLARSLRSSALRRMLPVIITPSGPGLRVSSRRPGRLGSNVVCAGMELRLGNAARPRRPGPGGPGRSESCRTGTAPAAVRTASGSLSGLGMSARDVARISDLRRLGVRRGPRLRVRVRPRLLCQCARRVIAALARSVDLKFRLGVSRPAGPPS